MRSKGIMFMVLGLVVGAFLFSGCEAGKVKQLQSEVTQLNQIIQQKDAQIKTLIDRVQSKEKELVGVKEELDNTKKELDSIKKVLDSIRKELDAVNQKVSVSAPAAALELAPVPELAPATGP